MLNKSQDHVKITGFYHPSPTSPILNPGIQICHQKSTQDNISISYGYISQVKKLQKVKFSKLGICQSVNRNPCKKMCEESVFFFNKILIRLQSTLTILIKIRSKLDQKSNLTLFWMLDDNFQKRRHFLLFFPKILNLQSD